MKDIFNNNNLIRTFSVLRKLFPSDSENEQELREKDRRLIAGGRLGEPVPHKIVYKDGKLIRDEILSCCAIFYENNDIGPDDIKLISDAGFDFILGGSTGEFGDMIIEECEKNGLALLGSDERVPHYKGYQKALEAGSDYFKGYRFSPCKIGDRGCDEPNASQYETLEKFRKLYHSAFPDKFLFYNLFPDGAGKKRMGAKNYREYVELYAKQVNTDYICLDQYPFFSFTAINKALFCVCLNSYDAVADACRRYGRDFWIYIQTQKNWFSTLYGNTTYEQIIWQMYAVLAYGARAIIHVSYAPVWGRMAVAMIDNDGNLTEQYLYSKRANAQLQKLSPVLSRYKSLGVLPTKSKKKNPQISLALNRQKKASERQGFYGIDIVREISSESSAIAGYFVNKDTGGYGIMLVNCKDMYDYRASQKIEISFLRKVSVSVYQKGELVKSAEVTGSLCVEPDSCEGVFVAVENK
jgi:hypothetical protein